MKTVKIPIEITVVVNVWGVSLKMRFEFSNSFLVLHKYTLTTPSCVM